MKRIIPVFIILFSFFYGCDDDPETTIKYFLKAKINQVEWTANTSLFADQAIVLTINGMNNNGSTLTLELNDVTPGTYTITKDRNHILYTDELANAFESKNSLPGTLTISENDASKNIVKGTFSVTLQSPLTGNIEIKEGNFELYYTE